MSLSAAPMQDVMEPNTAADAGSYFSAGMAPGATPLAYAVLTAFDATKAFLVVQNTDTVTASAPLGTVGRNLHMRHIRFSISTAPASATSAVLASVIDTTSRAPTAGSAVLTSVCNFSGGTNATGTAAVVSAFTGGAVITVPTATATARTIVGNLVLRAQIGVVGDEYLIQFGGREGGSNGVVTAAPAGASTIVKAHPPLVIAPSHFAVFHLWFPANSATGLSVGGLDVGFTMK